MRLEAKQEEMYKRMDRRNLYRRFSVIFAALGAGFIILIAAGYRNWLMVYYAALSVSGVVVLFLCYRKVDQYVMDMAGCFLELKEGRLDICQPMRAQEYERATIWLDEVEGIAAESRNGRPRFYAILKEDHKNSQIQADGTAYRIIRVESFGYTGEEFWSLFLKFREEISQSLGAIPLKISEHKKWRRIQPIPYPLLFVLLYFVPLIVPLLFTIKQ